MKSWFVSIEVALLIMVGLRILSGLIEISAAGLMLRLNSIEKAVAINAGLALVGPIIFISSISIGLLSMADRLSFTKICLIGAGVVLILLGIRK
ncbi:YqhV family protein [Halalkalibacterium ligniniphilum]|uniref:YqhV family protein n=1 Tax=Halalkalibacterium ligniniphilum TaxID=1134413 RepID=UPI00034CE579|nr:YqhV family protein [Halalkalibacterium ligniniphilum]